MEKSSMLSCCMMAGQKSEGSIRQIKMRYARLPESARVLQRNFERSGSYFLVGPTYQSINPNNVGPIFSHSHFR